MKASFGIAFHSVHNLFIPNKKMHGGCLPYNVSASFNIIILQRPSLEITQTSADKSKHIPNYDNFHPPQVDS